MRHSTLTAIGFTLPLVLLAGCGTTGERAEPAGSKKTAAVSKDAGAANPQSKSGKSPATAAPKQGAKTGTAAGSKPNSNDGAPKGFKRKTAKGVINVNKLIYPRRDIFGAYVEGPGNSTGTVADRNALGKQVGRQPTMIKRFYNWGDGLDQNWAKSLWKAGAIPQFELESWPDRGGATLHQIATGKADGYIKSLAGQIKKSNVPVAFSFAHEFNGDWYPWGYKKAKAADFVKAWRRMHNIFVAKGATNAIWMWSANQTHARPAIKLKPYWPGSAYVDWVGVIGYYYPESRKWIHTFHDVFDSTFTEVRKFTKKPILIAEAGTASARRDKTDISNFLYQVARRRYVIGFIWFNINKEQKWRIDASATKLKTFRTYIKKWPYAWNPKKP